MDSQPLIRWDIGTAYDLFISLIVLHNPEVYGLRASWAAGVRSRLTSEERATLELAQDVIFLPLEWIHKLPGEKNGESVLQALRQSFPERRLPELTFTALTPDSIKTTLLDIAERGKWSQKDLELYQEFYKNERRLKPKSKILSRILDAWARSEEFGEAYLSALNSYQRTFFAEEEKAILSTLQEGLAEAQRLAATSSVGKLVEQLTRGVLLREIYTQKEIIFIPSYWVKPLIKVRNIDHERELITFGVRPNNLSLVPGEVVPDSLLQSLQALSDPTRLKILRYLLKGSMTPAHLSRRLRLRPPTVSHHLSVLRLAEMVYVDTGVEGDRVYSARSEKILDLAGQIQEFLGLEQEKKVDENQ